MSPEAKLWRREYMGTFDPPLPPILTDEELDFMSMAIPLKELVRGLGGHEVPRDVVALAHHCIDGGYGDEVIERLRKIFRARGTKEWRMGNVLKHVVRYGVIAFRRLGDQQGAAKLEERGITRLRDLATHLGRMKVDYRSYEGHFAAGVAFALRDALQALNALNRFENAGPGVYETLMKNLGYLMSYASTGTAEEDFNNKAWIPILDEWLNAPLVEWRP